MDDFQRALAKALSASHKPENFRTENVDKMSFGDREFDFVICNAVLHFAADKAQFDRWLGEMWRVLKPGGRAVVLEFSRIAAPLKSAYDWYSFNVLPQMGKLVAGDEASYRYLAESIRMHPDQDTLRSMMEAAGLESVEYFNLAGGLVAVHRGYKF